MNDFFPYRGGELYAEEVPVAHIAAAVGTPFYLYSVGVLYRAIPRASPTRSRRAAADLLRGQGQLEPRGAARYSPASAPAPTSSRKASCAARSPPACRPSGSSFPGSARRGRDGGGARRRHPPDQCRVGARVAASERGGEQRAGRSRGSRSGSTPMSTPRPTPRSRPAARRTSSASSIPRRRRGVPARGASFPASSRSGWRCISARSSPISSRSRRAFERSPSSCVELRGDGLAVRARRSRRRHRHPLSRGRARPVSPASYAALGAARFSARSRSRWRSSQGGCWRRRPGCWSSQVRLCQGGRHSGSSSLDAAMNDLIRPALYDAWHDIVPVRAAARLAPA